MSGVWMGGGHAAWPFITWNIGLGWGWVTLDTVKALSLLSETWGNLSLDITINYLDSEACKNTLIHWQGDKHMVCFAKP